MSLFGQSFKSEVARSDEEDMESYVLQLAFSCLFQSQHKYFAENKCFVTLYLWLFFADFRNMPFISFTALICCQSRYSLQFCTVLWILKLL